MDSFAFVLVVRAVPQENDEDDIVIPGEQSETRNPGRVTCRICLSFLDARACAGMTELTSSPLTYCSPTSP